MYNPNSFNSLIYAPLNSPALTGSPTTPTAPLGDASGLVASTQFVDRIADRAAPSGAVMYFAMDSAPLGWMIADGSAVSRSLQPDLFAAIGTLWGAGDGSTTFLIPNLCGEFIRGSDRGRGVDPGRTTGTWQADEIKSHNHDLPLDASGVIDTATLVFTSGTDESFTGGLTGDRGGSETRPRNVALLPCIKL